MAIVLYQELLGINWQEFRPNSYWTKMAGVPIQRVIRKELAGASSQKSLGKTGGNVAPGELLGKIAIASSQELLEKMAGVSSRELLEKNGKSFVASSY